MADDLVAQIVHLFAYDVSTRIASAMSRGLVGKTRDIEAFGRGLREHYGNEEDTKAFLEPVAEAMRLALLDGYGDVGGYLKTVEAAKQVGSYRGGAGRLPGAMIAALAHPSMAVADGRGISYINKTLLNKEAIHWMRLNFGAQGSAVSNRTPRMFPVYFDQRILFPVGSEAQVRPAFSLPAGRWTNGSERVPFNKGSPSGELGRVSVDRFFPGGGGRGTKAVDGAGGKPSAYKTGGIVGANFIDAGFAAFAGEFGPALLLMHKKWTTDAAAFPRPSTTIKV